MPKKPTLCFALDGLAFPIRLIQDGRDRFTVEYGCQRDGELTYVIAAAKLGQAIMHALACDSRLDNRDAWTMAGDR
jgi:hypothetical protein